MASASRQMARKRKKAIDNFTEAMDSAISKVEEIRDWAYTNMMAARAMKERAQGLPKGMLPSDWQKM